MKYNRSPIKTHFTNPAVNTEELTATLSQRDANAIISVYLPLTSLGEFTHRHCTAIQLLKQTAVRTIADYTMKLSASWLDLQLSRRYIGVYAIQYRHRHAQQRLESNITRHSMHHQYAPPNQTHGRLCMLSAAARRVYYV